MTDSHNINQTIGGENKNAVQVGGNYTQTTSFNMHLIVSVFFISVVAFGGLAWSLNLFGQGPGGNAGFPATTEQAQ